MSIALSANYSYLADGTKLTASDKDGNGYVYMGSLVYRREDAREPFIKLDLDDNAISTQGFEDFAIIRYYYDLESVPFDGGRLTVSKVAGSNIYTPRYHSTDHLGSVRTVVDGGSSETVEKNDYDPFGSRIVDATNEISDNRYRYNGKEEQAFLKLPFIDYGARMYDPKIAMRWNRPDPLAEKYPGISPYAFCANNPINFVDPNGMDWYRSLSGSLTWRDDDRTDLTINNEWYRNVGKSHSIKFDDNCYVNFYQNVAISTSLQAIDAEQTVLGSTALTGVLLGKDSPLAAGAQQGLMNDLVRQAQGDFIMGSLEYSCSAMQFAGDAMTTTGYAFSVSGVGATAGAPLITAGNIVKNIGTVMDIGFDVMSGNYRRTGYNAFTNITMYGIGRFGKYISKTQEAIYNLILAPYGWTMSYGAGMIQDKKQ